jgi:hypothetical protein
MDPIVYLSSAPLPLAPISPLAVQAKRLPLRQPALSFRKSPPIPVAKIILCHASLPQFCKAIQSSKTWAYDVVQLYVKY